MTDWPKVHSEKLTSIIEKAFNGEVVLPEFQRSFIWGRQQVEELLVSVLSGYFIGNLLALDSFGTQKPFPPRFVEGLNDVNPSASIVGPPKLRYILDGQQRITAIFYALYAPPIPLKGSKSPYKFFIDVEKLLANGPEEAIRAIQTKASQDLNKAEKDAKEGRLLSFTLLRDLGATSEWLWSKQNYSKTSENKLKLLEYIKVLHEFTIPVISIDEAIGIVAIVDTFERINRTGTRLSTFDLLVARLYPTVKLRDLWQSFELEASMAWSLKPDEVTNVVDPDYPAKVVSLIRGKGCKKTAILELDRAGFDNDWIKATTAIIDATKRFRQMYGVTDLKRDVPYYAMIVSLAALLQRIGELGKSKSLYDKLDKWYWAAVFSERYESSADTYASTDYNDIGKWLQGEKMPEWIGKVSADLKEETFDVKDTRSAIYRGVRCIITLSGAKDLFTGQPPALAECEDDHLFPKSKYKEHPQLVDSVLNRTLIDKTTNSMKLKGAKNPSEYLKSFAEQLGSEKKLIDILQTHLIDQDAYKAMKQDDLDAFIKARGKSVLEQVRSRV